MIHRAESWWFIMNHADLSLWLEPCWDHVGIILLSFLHHTGTIVGSSWDHFGTTLGSHWDHFGTILGPCGNHFGTIWETRWGHIGTIVVSKPDEHHKQKTNKKTSEASMKRHLILGSLGLKHWLLFDLFFQVVDGVGEIDHLKVKIVRLIPLLSLHLGCPKHTFKCLNTFK